VASATIVAPAAEQALEQARLNAERQALLDGYASFRAIIDGYAEDPRPGADDVESVLSVLSAAVSVNAGQLVYEAAAPAFEGQRLITAPLGRDKPLRTSLQKPVHMSGQGLTEGRTWYLRLAPGVMGLRCSDENKKERARERQKERERKAADMLSAACGLCPITALRPAPAAGEIREWSARSRMRLSELVGSLDFSDWSQADGALAMVTLTLPGDWLTVAPDGKTFKKLLKRFELRWRRALGAWRCLWKLEFQGRGAPHWHALMRVPALVGRSTFEEWLSKTWADVVDHPDAAEKEKHLKAGTGVDFSGKDFSDPRRIALYFLGHSAKTTDGKEYQHTVPEEWQKAGKGPGRFWGSPGFESAAREMEMTERDAVQAARVLRKVKKARTWTVAVLREQGAAKREHKPVPGAFSIELRAKAGQKRGRAAHRTYNRKLAAAAAARGDVPAWQPRFTPSSLGAGGYAVGGWVLVNDGLQLGIDLARYFELRSAGAVG
jgi:hypothetical protein